MWPRLISLLYMRASSLGEDAVVFCFGDGISIEYDLEQLGKETL